MVAKRAKNILIGNPGTSRANKTGSWRVFMPVYDKTKCTACGMCAMLCPDGCIHGDKAKKYDPDYDYCKGCGVCAKVCPVKCITMKEEQK